MYIKQHRETKMKDFLTTDILVEEMSKWPNSNRNKGDIRFGQYIFNNYTGISDQAYFVEDKDKAFQIIYDEIQDYQR